MPPPQKKTRPVLDAKATVNAEDANVSDLTVLAEENKGYKARGEGANGAANAMHATAEHWDCSHNEKKKKQKQKNKQTNTHTQKKQTTKRQQMRLLTQQRLSMRHPGSGSYEPGRCPPEKKKAHTHMQTGQVCEVHKAKIRKTHTHTQTHNERWQQQHAKGGGGRVKRVQACQ